MCVVHLPSDLSDYQWTGLHYTGNSRMHPEAGNPDNQSVVWETGERALGKVRYVR